MINEHVARPLFCKSALMWVSITCCAFLVVGCSQESDKNKTEGGSEKSSTGNSEPNKAP
jgi:hypothetical protein